jgi:hypothetical protein
LTRISKAIIQLATGGQNSDLAKFEQEYFIMNGGSPNPDLQAFLQDPTGKTSALTDGKAAQA